MKKSLATAFVVAALGSGVCRADAIHNLATALSFTGFDIIGEPNPLSGGANLLITQQFNNSRFDFGSAEFTLNGPVSLGISTGGRILPVFDVSLTTAVNSQATASPLSFSSEIDYGPQIRTVSGSTLIDADFSINALGFYDFSLTYSTRSTLEREGLINDSDTYDSDVGPIRVSGNIFVDALELLTDPFFEQTGQTNPFSVLSKNMIDLQEFDLGTLLASSESTPQELAGLVHELETLQPAVTRTTHSGYIAHMVVPEPPVLVLLLVGLPVMIYRGFRAR